MPKWPSPPLGRVVSLAIGMRWDRGGWGEASGRDHVKGPYTPMTATFFPGPTPARTSGLQTVRPAHIMGPASVVEMLSGMGKVKYSCARM